MKIGLLMFLLSLCSCATTPRTQSPPSPPPALLLDGATLSEPAAEQTIHPTDAEIVERANMRDMLKSRGYLKR